MADEQTWTCSWFAEPKSIGASLCPLHYVAEQLLPEQPVLKKQYILKCVTQDQNRASQLANLGFNFFLGGIQTHKLVLFQNHKVACQSNRVDINKNHQHTSLKYIQQNFLYLLISFLLSIFLSFFVLSMYWKPQINIDFCFSMKIMFVLLQTNRSKINLVLYPFFYLSKRAIKH